MQTSKLLRGCTVMPALKSNNESALSRYVHTYVVRKSSMQIRAQIDCVTHIHLIFFIRPIAWFQYHAATQER